ncbi:MAG: LapA family protein [Bacteroidales bacterium]|nr:LapA family protein [Bacteroidales bacterium]
MQKILLLSFILAILAVIFAIQNSGPVNLVFYFWRIDLPLALVIVFSMTIGAVLGILFLYQEERRRKLPNCIKPKNKPVKEKEKELNQDFNKNAGKIYKKLPAFNILYAN